MDITLATFTRFADHQLPGVRFRNAWSPSQVYKQARLSTLTGQYFQREPVTRITDVFADAGYTITESPAARGENVFRLLEEPNVQALSECPGVIAATSLLDAPVAMSVYWPEVATSGESNELVSPLDLAPTLAAIAGLDVRPNARLSFDGLNLVPVLRHGAAGHGALFFEDGSMRGPQGLIEGETRADEWNTWHQFMTMGPLQ